MSSGWSRGARALAASPLPGFVLAGLAAGAIEGAFVPARGGRLEIVAFSAGLATTSFSAVGAACWAAGSLGRRLPPVKVVLEWVAPLSTSEPDADRKPVVLAHGFVLALVAFAGLSAATAAIALPALFRLQVEEIGMAITGGLWVAFVALAPIVAVVGAKLLHGPLARFDAFHRLPFPRSVWARFFWLATAPTCATFYPFLRGHGAMVGPVRDVLLVLLIAVVGIQVALLLRKVPERASAAIGTSLVTLGLVVSVSVAALHGRRAERAFTAENAMLASLGGRLGRNITDVDRDGASSLFGGKDCAPFDRKRAPGALEVLGNGIDEDCDGRDSATARSDTSISERFSGALTASQVKPYNIVWVIIDAVRADHVGTYGYDKPTMPFFDALSGESLLFTNAWAPSSATIISIPSQLAGRDPAAMTWFWERKHLQVDRGEVLLAERLAKAGYETGAVVSSYIQSSIPHALRGFEQVYIGEDKQRKADKSRRNLVATARAAEFLSRIDPDDKFFLLVYYPDPHYPYTRHADVDSSKFARDDLGNYDTELAWTDQQIRTLVGMIQAREALWKNTIVIVTSDHGEEFKEHGGTQHALTCHVEVTHVPLLVRIPGMPARRIEAPVTLTDIVPTLLELTGQTEGAGELTGQSLLVPALSSAKVDEGRPLFCSITSITDAYGTFFRRSVRQGHFALFQDVNGGRFQLFDTEDDPGEQRDLSSDPAHAQRLEQMKAILAASLTGNLKDHTKW